MIARTLFWKKFKKLIFGSFAIVFGIFTCCFLGSWTNNNNGSYTQTNYYNPAYFYYDAVDLPSIFDLDETYIDENIFYATYYTTTYNDTLPVYNLNNCSIDLIYDFSNYSYKTYYIFGNVDLYAYLYVNNNLQYDDSISFTINANRYIFNGNYYIEKFINSSSNTDYYYSYINNINNFFNYSSYESIGDSMYIQLDFRCQIYAITDQLILDNELNNTLYNQSYVSNLQNDYNNLNQQYQDYQSSHSYTNTQYDTLATNYNNLGSEYATYQNTHSYTNTQYDNLTQQYQDYQSSHSYTNTQYDNLNQQYIDYQNSHSYSNTQYNALLQQYNDLLNSSSNINKLNYHIWIASQNGSQTQYDFTKVQQLSSSDYIDDLGYMDISSIYTSYIDGTNNVILVELDNSLNALNYDLMFNVNGSGNNINIMPKFINFNPVQTPLFGLTSTNNSSLTLTNFIKYQDSSVTNIVNYAYSEFAIIYTNLGNDLINIKLNGQGDYNLGYLNGLEQNNADFVDLQQDYDDLSINYDTLQGRYDVLLDQYNTLANGHLELSMRNLVWYIASTPFESFKSIWNVDFLGLNIASFFTGLFSVFIIVWILKKIF